MTIFAVYVDGIFRDTFEGESVYDVLAAAVEEYGFDQAGAYGIEAYTLNEVIRMIREYADQPIEELVAEWSNQSEVEVDEDGDIWIANPSQGHWLNEDAKARFVEWCESR